jgi:ribosomal protein S18 acetylase RimI-like enzyme
MEDETSVPNLIVRRAAAEDYAAFERLFPELMVDDPVPSLHTWASVLCPSTLIAARAGKVLGYCYVQEYFDTGYVRNIVVAPAARRSGVGSSLMLPRASSFERGASIPGA